MTWETVENNKPSYASKPVCPALGLVFSVRRAAGRVVTPTSYISVTVGGELARKASFTLEQHRCRLLTGGGSDAGKIKIQVDNEAGDFLAKRQKSGVYKISINKLTAEGLFSLEFEKFLVPSAEIVRPENGQPVFFLFKPRPTLFAADD